MMKLAVLLLTSALAFKAPMEKSRVYILCYHGFLSDTNKFSFLQNELKSHLDNLVKNGFKFVTVSDIRNNRLTGYKNILVSVDDGNRTVYQAYHNVLKPMGIKPLLAIYPAVISYKDYALTWEQLKELSDDGCEIAAHGYNHLFVNEKLSKTNSKAFHREIFLSKSTLEKKLGRTIDIFVYPFGVRSEITKETLKEAGYKIAFTIVGRRLNPAEIDGPDRYELPRYLITRVSWKSSFMSIATDSTSTRPAIAMRNKKPAEGRKGHTVISKPVIEPKAYRDKYIYNESGGPDTSAERKVMTAGFMGSEKSIPRDEVKTRPGPMSVSMNTRDATGPKDRIGNEKNESKYGFLFFGFNKKIDAGPSSVPETSRGQGEKKETSYLGRLKEGYFSLLTGCSGIYDSWVGMMYSRMELIRKKFILLWKVLSS